MEPRVEEDLEAERSWYGAERKEHDGLVKHSIAEEAGVEDGAGKG